MMNWPPPINEPDVVHRLADDNFKTRVVLLGQLETREERILKDLAFAWREMHHYINPDKMVIVQYDRRLWSITNYECTIDRGGFFETFTLQPVTEIRRTADK